MEGITSKPSKNEDVNLKSHASFIEEVDENGLFYLVVGKEIIGGMQY